MEFILPLGLSSRIINCVQTQRLARLERRSPSKWEKVGTGETDSLFSFLLWNRFLSPWQRKVGASGVLKLDMGSFPVQKTKALGSEYRKMNPGSSELGGVLQVNPPCGGQEAPCGSSEQRWWFLSEWL